MNDQQLIDACRRQDRQAQQELYNRYAPPMFGVCRRYLRQREDAEDVLVEGFFKVFANIHQFKGSGSFKAWMQRIMVNQALMFLRKKHNFHLTVEVDNIEIRSDLTVEDELAAQDILNLLERLPTGYRTVFNLYVIEGYKHREIADILGISINTSKSQLILAKKRMQSLIGEQNQLPDVG